MNLLRVQDKLKSREYSTVENVLDDLQLIWDNCKLYNPEGPFYVLADKMERNFKKMVKNYLPNINIIIPSTPLEMQNPSGHGLKLLPSRSPHHPRPLPRPLSRTTRRLHGPL